VRQDVEDLTRAMQIAIGLATAVRRTTQETADDAVTLEAAVGRAVSALRRPRPRGKGGRR
jgi:hypothetical protein